MTNMLPFHAELKKEMNMFCFLRIIVCLTLTTLLTANTSFAHNGDDYDEVPVLFTVPGAGSVEVPAVIYHEAIYLPVTNIFDFLRIKNTISPGLDSIVGFFTNPQVDFTIDNRHHQILFGSKIFAIKDNDLIQTENNLYLRSDYFGLVFGLHCSFNFRRLSVLLTTSLELPVIREMRQEAMRTNVRKLTGEIKADTSIGLSRPLFHAGVADWAVITTQNTKAANNTRVNLALGATIAGGETTIGLNYDSYLKFAEKQQYYLWRYVQNDHAGLRQVMAGKIFTQSASSIFTPVVGVQFTNTPTTYRRSFGSYVLSDHTQPNWTVELYVNNVLVDYVKADASGFFTFEVPMVYGSTSVKLRFYGLYGEERTTERNIDVPFNFLPENQFEYTFSAGMVQDSLHSRFSRASMNYGLGKRITIGGGLEYLSSVTTGRFMPFVNASLRIASNLLAFSEYIHGVKMKQVLNYRLPSQLQFELMYSRYKKGQKAINNSFLEERRAMVSFPFRGRHLSVFSRMTVYQTVVPSSKFSSSAKYTNAEALFSGSFLGVNANFTTFALFTGTARPYVYSNLSSSLRLPANVLVTPQIQYEYNRHTFINARVEVGKYMSAKGFINVFYERNFKYQIEGIGIGFRYDFSFTQISSSARSSNHTTTFVQAARGSVMYDGAAKYLGVNNRTSVGRGGIIIIPFVDVNGNGKRDVHEPRAFGLTIQSSAGTLQYIKSDTAIVITNLEAYTDCLLRLNTGGFEYIGWQIKNKTISIEVSPNQLRQMDVAVSVMNEVTGRVFTNAGQDHKGTGRIIVRFYNAQSKQVGETLTEEDGSFSYIGLLPGSYTARIDAGQLNNLELRCSPEKLSFTISMSTEGDTVDGLEFLLEKNSPGLLP